MQATEEQPKAESPAPDEKIHIRIGVEITFDADTMIDVEDRLSELGETLRDLGYSMAEGDLIIKINDRRYRLKDGAVTPLETTDGS